MPHRLSTEHDPASSFQYQVNAKSCYKYSTIVSAKKYDNKMPNIEKRLLLGLFSQRGHKIAIAYKLKLTVLLWHWVVVDTL